MHKFEIEIKSLLGSKTKADELITKMQEADPNLKVLGTHSELNHYFVDGDLKALYNKFSSLLSGKNRKKLKDLANRAKSFSVRTRQADNKILLVVKATIDDTTSENGTARLEFEVTIPKEKGVHTIDDLDKLLLGAGFKYQAKWSRERSEYNFKDLNVSIDKNAGYGYLAEFEKVIDNASKAGNTKQIIRRLIGDLGVEELSQDRLQRMFDFYNANWRDYYGTDKTFIVE